MRNPVGPLPSSIYWRRRAVAGLLVALLAVLIAWAVTSVGGGGSKDDGKPGGSDPVKSITPGPGSSGPAISQQPGGRDESDDSEGSDGSGGSDGGSGSGGDTGAGSGGASGGTGSDGTSTGGAATAGSGAGGTASGGSAAGRQVPANSPLPECKPGGLELTLRTKVGYGPEDRPRFDIIARNTSSVTCKADLGPKNVVLKVTEASADNDDVIWSSKDCPAAPGALFLQVPAGATIVHTVDWNRVRSAPNCATPPATKAGPGTYLLEAETPGTKIRPASFVLKKD
nr:hypothetical protein [Streptomyces sp. SID8374]